MTDQETNVAIKMTDEMREAVRRRMGVPNGVALDPWMEAAISDVLAIVERDRPMCDHGPRPMRIPHCPVVDDLCPGDSRGVLCLTSCRDA